VQSCRTSDGGRPQALGALPAPLLPRGVPRSEEVHDVHTARSEESAPTAVIRTAQDRFEFNIVDLKLRPFFASIASGCHRAAARCDLTPQARPPPGFRRIPGLHRRATATSHRRIVQQSTVGNTTGCNTNAARGRVPPRTTGATNDSGATPMIVTATFWTSSV